MKEFMKVFKGVAFAGIVLILLLLSCSHNDEIPQSDLELRDTLIYKKDSNIPFTGREKSRIENKIIEYDVVNGMKQGDFLLYYESGKMEIKGHLDHNKNVGHWQYFYESGQVESEGLFVNNLPDGIWKWYNRSGTLREEGSYKNGQRFGTWRQYDETGNITKEKEFPGNDSTKVEEDYLEKLKNNNYKK